MKLFEYMFMRSKILYFCFVKDAICTSEMSGQTKCRERLTRSTLRGLDLVWPGYLNNVF